MVGDYKSEKSAIAFDENDAKYKQLKYIEQIGQFILVGLGKRPENEAVFYNTMMLNDELTKLFNGLQSLTDTFPESHKYELRNFRITEDGDVISIRPLTCNTARARDEFIREFTEVAGYDEWKVREAKEPPLSEVSKPTFAAKSAVNTSGSSPEVKIGKLESDKIVQQGYLFAGITTEWEKKAIEKIDKGNYRGLVELYIEIAKQQGITCIDLSKKMYYYPSPQTKLWVELHHHQVENHFSGMFTSQIIPLATKYNMFYSFILSKLHKDDPSIPHFLGIKAKFFKSVELHNKNKLTTPELMKLVSTGLYNDKLYSMLDTNQYTLAFGEGKIFDFKKGEVRNLKHDDLCSLASSVKLLHSINDYRTKPELRNKLIDKFLRDITSHDEEQLEHLLREMGYNLTGDTSKRIFSVHSGIGNNGKSILIALMKFILGSKLHTADASLILESKTGSAGGARADLLAIKGKTMVVISEPDDGRGIVSANLKSLTSGCDEITARGLYSNQLVSFTPYAKFSMWCNAKPLIIGIDKAVITRLCVTEWLTEFRPIDEINESNASYTREQIDGIGRILMDDPEAMSYFFYLLLEGAMRALAMKGWIKTKKIIDATAEYRDASDIIGNFLGEECDKQPSDSKEEYYVAVSDLYLAYEGYAKTTGSAKMTKTKFCGIIQNKYGKGVNRDHKKSYLGIRLKPKDTRSFLLDLTAKR